MAGAVPLAEAKNGDIAVSQPGSIAAAIVNEPGGRPFVGASICASYEKPHPPTGKMSRNLVEASVHQTWLELFMYLCCTPSLKMVARVVLMLGGMI